MHCVFDELRHDVPHNRIIKASLKRLSRAPTLDPILAHELRLTARRFSDVSDIWLERSAFSRVRLNRNNAFYGLLLKVAELAFDCLLPDPNGEGFLFQDVMRDEMKMARVFEDFVRNFYKAESAGLYVVEPLAIEWDATDVEIEGAGRLPVMRTDIFLRWPARRLIIGAKYYANALQTHHGSESFRSENLYQLHAYITNAEAMSDAFRNVEGMLLYPQVGHALDASGHRVHIATLDLARGWSINAHIMGRRGPHNISRAAGVRVRPFGAQT